MVLLLQLAQQQNLSRCCEFLSFFQVNLLRIAAQADFTVYEFFFSAIAGRLFFSTGRLLNAGGQQLAMNKTRASATLPSSQRRERNCGMMDFNMVVFSSLFNKNFFCIA
jgi:hypothetical protein